MVNSYTYQYQDGIEYQFPKFLTVEYIETCQKLEDAEHYLPFAKY